MLHTRWRAEASGWTATDGHGQDAGPAGDLLLGESGLLHRDPPVPVEDRRSGHVLKSKTVQFRGGRSKYLYVQLSRLYLNEKPARRKLPPLPPLSGRAPRSPRCRCSTEG